MKSNKLLIAAVSIIAMLSTLWGCGKMDDTYSEFIKNGETIYIAKADSVKAHGGRNRIQLSWLLLSDPKIAKYKVYWNNRRDSVVNLVTKTANVDTVKLMLTDMEEGTHQFEIFTYDKLGNTSVKATIIGEVYGNRYNNALLPATYAKLTRKTEDMEITWTAPNEDLVGIDIVYLNKLNAEKKIHVNAKDETTILQDFPKGGAFRYISSFLPEPNALDTFRTATTQVKVLLDSVKWNDYDQILEHLDYIIGNNNGSLHHFLGNLQDGFATAKAVGAGFSFKFLISHNNALIAQKTTGEIVWYPLSAVPAFGTSKSLGIDWTNSNLMFSNIGNIITRLSNGELWLRPISTTGVGGTKVKINGTWSAYNGIWGNGNYLTARTPDGKLWSIPFSSAGVAGVPFQIATGWDKFNWISSYNTGLLARNSSGQLWYYPLNTNGTLGTPSLIVISWELI